MHKYGRYIYNQAAEQVEDITAEDVMYACTKCKHSAAGTDLWSPADFSLLSLKAFDHIAQLLNIIEEGFEWPESVLFAKAA